MGETLYPDSMKNVICGETMKKLVIGILAHVDAGKTTLSEGLLYVSGVLRKLGRVDHRNAFLDTDALERERGITIFAKQAELETQTARITLLDTPGHVDFSAEMERTLQVLDCAILVISGTDGVQSHTRTLWRLLKRYGVPTFLFINKMDLSGADKTAVMAELTAHLDGGCVDFTASREERDEGVAMGGEEALEQFLETGAVQENMTRALIRERKIFPCWFGSALKVEGVEEFLEGLSRYAVQPDYPAQFGAKVFKISRDAQGARLTWLKITGGSLKAKTVLSGGAGDDCWQEKADQLRIYSGSKFKVVDEVSAGAVVAVTGLTRAIPGQGFGVEPDSPGAVLEPVLTYQLILPDGIEPHTALPRLRQLEEEDPMLRIVWSERWKEIHVQLMGRIQLEVLQRLIADRFGMEVTFGSGTIVYKETIANTVEGVGHFEPLRHYAEAHLLMEPGERGSGIQVCSACPTDALELNWQRLIFTHVLEREHPGVLTGSPITDIKFTLVAGRAHLKHTEGGDFRQATYRAIRQGLMQAQSVLLEPFYDFRLELPAECMGRAMTDIQGMGGSVDAPEQEGELTVLTGFAPVAGLRDYWQDVTAYTRGRGRLSCTVRGYEPCKEQARIVEEMGYDPERDTENPADSVFCSHGSGDIVKWNEVFAHMHVHSGIDLRPRGEQIPEQPVRRRASQGGSIEQDRELLAIFERTYGKVERRAFEPTKKPARTELSEKYNIREQYSGPEYLLVDGYNIIFAWEELAALAKQDVAAARGVLTDILCNYRGYQRCEVILVFDAYKVKGNPGSVEKVNGIYVVYTKEAETADTYIEKTTYDLGRHHRVRVATSDGLEQVIILGHGALRLSARAFKTEVEQAQGNISRLIDAHNRQGRGGSQLKFTAKIKPGK